ncbi:MAG: bacteriohemerythrin [Actinomycetota bacterium]
MGRALQWDDRYSCGHPVLDRQHRYLIDTANEIRREFGNSNAVALHCWIRRLLDYTEYHFISEEAVMARRNSPDAAEHAAEHVVIRTYLEELWAIRDQMTPEELFETVAEWVVNHVLVTDQCMGPTGRPPAQ